MTPSSLTHLIPHCPEGAALIPLSRGRAYALVDEADYADVSRYTWQISSHGYAQTHSSGAAVFMHRLIMQTPKGSYVDHINHEPLNNRRSNLRICTQAENLRNQGKHKNNTSGFKGVTFFKRDGTWKAQVTHNRRNLHLGYFSTAEAAARAYDRKAREIHGEFARLNFPD